MRRKRRDIFGDGKYLVCAGEEERRSKRRKTFRMKYLKRVIILSAEEKKSIKRKGTNNMEMMIQLDMMVKKHDANSWSKRHFNAKCTHLILILGVFTPILGVATRFSCCGGGGVPKFINIRQMADS